MARYAENAYRYFKRKGLDVKYEHAGIYCIKIDDSIVYIGKSNNMLRRVAQHYAGIKMQSEKKYRLLAESQWRGHTVGFDVLYYAKEQNISALTKEIGKKESEYIRKYKPILNTQIRKETDWRKYDFNKVDPGSVRETF